jgi:peptidoglycan/LPS O-acetylase OafA/YrhL
MYINNFDYLRHFAALMVLVSHAFVIYFGVEYEPKYQGVTAGSLAVCIFFVLSGFLINGATDRNTHTRFVIARVLRLYPAAIACMLVTVFLIGPIYTSLTLQEYLSSGETYGYLRNSSLVLLFQDSLPGLFLNNPFPASVNGSLWTLPVELRAYILAAVATFFSRGKKVVTLGIFMMLLSVFYYQKINGLADPRNVAICLILCWWVSLSIWTSKEDSGCLGCCRNGILRELFPWRYDWICPLVSSL